MKIGQNKVAPAGYPLPKKEPSRLQRLFPCFSQTPNVNVGKKAAAWASVEKGNAILDNIDQYKLEEPDKLEIFQHILTRETDKNLVLQKAENFNFSNDTKLQILSSFLKSSQTKEQIVVNLIALLKLTNFLNRPEMLKAILKTAGELTFCYTISIIIVAFYPLVILEHLGTLPLKEEEKLDIAKQIAEKVIDFPQEGLELCNFSDAIIEKINKAKESGEVQAALYNGKNTCEDPIHYLAYKLKYQERQALLKGTLQDLLLRSVMISLA